MFETEFRILSCSCCRIRRVGIRRVWASSVAYLPSSCVSGRGHSSELAQREKSTGAEGDANTAQTKHSTRLWKSFFIKRKGCVYIQEHEAGWDPGCCSLLELSTESWLGQRKCKCMVRTHLCSPSSVHLLSKHISGIPQQNQVETESAWQTVEKSGKTSSLASQSQITREGLGKQQKRSPANTPCCLVLCFGRLVLRLTFRILKLSTTALSLDSLPKE